MGELIGEEGDDNVEEIVEEEISKSPETDKDDEAEDMDEDEEEEEEEDTSDYDDDDGDVEEELEIDEQLKGDLKAALGDAAVKEDNDNENDSDLEDLDMDTVDPKLMQDMDAALSQIFMLQAKK